MFVFRSGTLRVRVRVRIRVTVTALARLGCS